MNPASYNPSTRKPFRWHWKLYWIRAKQTLFVKLRAESSHRMQVLTFVLLLTLNFVVQQTSNAENPCPEKKLNESIYKAAASCQGKKMWTGYGLSEGTLGCAAALSNVLKIAGITDAHSAAVVPLRRQLLRGSHEVLELKLKNGELKPIDNELILNSAHPGDILLAFSEPPSKPNLGGHAHCGIMSFGLFVFTNDWNDGIWKRVDIHSMFDGYTYIRLIRILPAQRKPGN